MKFDYIKAPLNRYTFLIKPIREWVEQNCEGIVLNLYGGKTRLNTNTNFTKEISNDLDETMPTDYHKDALQLVQEWNGGKFNTIVLDPPYAARKSMEMYGGRMASPFNQLKDVLPTILENKGIIITFGYHSVSMGKIRGFEVEKILLISHGGAIHDTIATIERRI